MVAGRKTVLLALAWHLEKLMQGVADYARQHNWHLVILRGNNFPEALRRWQGDGIISSFWNADTENVTEEILADRSWVMTRMVSLVPVRSSRIPCRVVRENDYEIGQLAAEYFLRRGHTSFAAYSDSVRLTGFRDRLRRSGMECVSKGPFRSVNENDAELSEWLQGLSKPCAVFCENDWDAAELLNTALWSGIKVPTEVAILGVGNDTLLCHASAVTLSSIDSRLYELGQLAAKELEKLIDGVEEPEGALLLKPNPLVMERQSSDFFAVENPQLREVADFLRFHSAEPLSIAKVSRQFHTSSSALYKLFNRNLNISPKQFLQEQRLVSACKLLQVERPGTMNEIADRAGFPTTCAMFSAFQKRFSCTPGVWRQLNQSFVN